MYKGIPGIHEKQSFTVGELARLFDMTVQGIHRWIELEKVRDYDRTSRRGKYQIPRREVIRLLKEFQRPVPGLWEPELRQAKVVVIDDYAPIRKLIKDAFQNSKLPLSAQVAASLHAGLLLVGHWEPHVVVVDNIPDSDKESGNDAIGFIKSVKTAYPRTKLIGTGPTRKIGLMMLRAGADAFLQKPFTLEELKNMILLQTGEERRVRDRRTPLLELVVDATTP